MVLSKLAAALVFVVGAALVALADAPFIRYASVALEGPKFCYVNQFQNLPSHVNVLVLGSSRLWSGVDPATMTQASDGRLANVFNLSAPGVNVARSATVFEEIIQSDRTVDVVIVEAPINALRRGAAEPWVWDPAAAGRATWGDIITKTPRLVGEGVMPDPRLVARGLHLKLEQALLMLASGEAASVVANADSEPTPICRGDYFFEDTASTAGSTAARREDFSAEVRRSFPFPERSYDHVYRPPTGSAAMGDLQLLERMRAQAQAAGVKMLVVRPQSYEQPALDPVVVEKLTELIPEFRYPPEPLARRLNRLVFDGTHYGLEGRVLYSNWLAETILTEEATAD